MTTTKPQFALLISTKSVTIDSTYRDENAGRCELSVVEILESGKLRNVSATDLDKPLFDDLVFYCQWTDKIADGEPFAFECEYRGVYSVDLPKAERQLKMLRKIRKAQDGFPVRPTTFGQFCALLAKALGISVVKKTTKRSTGWSYDDAEY